jgi:hypothetical protein
MKRALSFAFVIGSVVAIVTACSVDVDLKGKGCPCPTGLFCDESTNTCVTTPPTGAAGDAGPPPAACNDAECACKVDADCTDPDRRVCGPSGTCVQCVAGANDRCTAGGYCNDKNQCVAGCKSDGDCQGQRCNTATHRCVDCVMDGECTAAGPNAKCTATGKCAASCTGTGPCGTNGTCCNNLCLDLTNDTDNCGRCGNGCSNVNNTPTCVAGVCTFNQCALGYAHCRPPGENTGCETNIRTAAACGSCTKVCSLSTVQFANNIGCSSDNKCTFQSCIQGHVNGDGNPENGCEGTCGNKGETCCKGPGQMACNDGSGCKGSGNCQ